MSKTINYNKRNNIKVKMTINEIIFFLFDCGPGQEMIICGLDLIFFHVKTNITNITTFISFHLFYKVFEIFFIFLHFFHFIYFFQELISVKTDIIKL